jgi:hypothetical protein
MKTIVTGIMVVHNVLGGCLLQCFPELLQVLRWLDESSIEGLGFMLEGGGLLLSSRTRYPPPSDIAAAMTCHIFI